MIVLESNIIMLLDMFEKSCVMAVFAYFFVRTQFFQKLLAKKISIRQRIVLGMIFTLFSVYGIVNGLLVEGNFVALSHPGQILAGLFAGPVLGGSVGAVAAIIRFSLGGEQALVSTLTSLSAGVLAGFYYRWKRGAMITVKEAVLFTASFEIAARLLKLFFSPDFTQAIKIQALIIMPMLLGHVMMVGIFIFVANTLLEERKNRTIQERLENDIRMARDIQLSLVPKIFPTFPDNREIDVFALLQPAKEVGGDIYDFFFIDAERFCFVIGDVSGKGMPAALFMSGTKTLFKAQADREMDTADILDRVNNELCRGNDSSMFVTLFCGILHIHTGEMIYSNAGHNPPYLYHQGGELEAISDKHGLALGVLENVAYGSGRMRLQAGDTLILYTDGVTEAMDSSDEMFEVQRLEQVIQKNKNHRPQELLQVVMNEVEQFVGEAEQSDDITMLALTYRRL